MSLLRFLGLGGMAESQEHDIETLESEAVKATPVQTVGKPR
jgi:hypothetical protein